MATSWRIVNNLVSQNLSDIGHFAVLILNRPISLPEDLVTSIWNAACLRATADGGTDRWYHFVESMRDKSKLLRTDPDLVTGDFDSITPEKLNHVQEIDTIDVEKTPDMDYTDFTKCLKTMMQRLKLDSVIVVVENSGRMDHIMSNMNTLYLKEFSGITLFLLASDNVTWLLQPGKHRVHIPHVLIESQATCGLIPLGAPCTVTTSGFKWNLCNTKMEFGGLVSSSNTYDKSCNGLVIVETDSPLLITINFEGPSL